jgi:tetratricopeptide (TPR) repeat protein
MTHVFYNIGIALKKIGKNDESSEYLHKAIQGYRELLVDIPDSVTIVSRLANALLETGNPGEATTYLQQAVIVDPYNVKSHSKLAEALVTQQRYDEAIAGLEAAVEFFSDTGDKEAAVKLQNHLETVKLEMVEKSENKK